MTSSTVTTNRWASLAVLCAAAFTINAATMIVNVSLPTLTRDLDASSRDLLWIVDAFNLVFAAFVLAAGSLSDRFGRKGVLLAGLALYVTASAAAAAADTANELILWRGVAGLGAAAIFPTTLSLITNIFPDRAERARAIGLWGAATGIAIAVGPIVGGALLEQFYWGSAFLFCAALGAAVLVAALRLVPTSRDPGVPRLDAAGLVLSTLAVGTLVLTLIEAPDRGWTSARTSAGFVVAVVLLAAFTAWERRVDAPMLDVRLFADLRFTAASGAVTLAFFALFGFIYLIAQYFQFILGYGVLEAGLRQIPVALSVAAASVLGTRIAVRFGTKAVVTAGLLMLVGGYLWISTVGAGTGYLVIALQMATVGTGLGLTSAPATEAIIGVVPAARAGVGSAVNDATRELGGTLGVAVIGSVAVSVYRDGLGGSGLPPAARAAAGQLLGAAGELAQRTGDAVLLAAAQQSFLDGLAAGCYVAAAVALVGAALTALYLPAHPDRRVGALPEGARRLRRQRPRVPGLSRRAPLSRRLNRTGMNSG